MKIHQNNFTSINPLFFFFFFFFFFFLLVTLWIQNSIKHDHYDGGRIPDHFSSVTGCPVIKCWHDQLHCLLPSPAVAWASPTATWCLPLTLDTSPDKGKQNKLKVQQTWIFYIVTWPRLVHNFPLYFRVSALFFYTSLNFLSSFFLFSCLEVQVYASKNFSCSWFDFLSHF